jgi:hypothetical protein
MNYFKTVTKNVSKGRGGTDFMKGELFDEESD